MSLVPTWVRCRDGAFYSNPLLSFREGFICFDDREPPEIVLWVGGSVAGAPISASHATTFVDPDPIAALDRVISPSGYKRLSVEVACRSMRIIPGDPSGVIEMAPAVSFYFELSRRIPKPTSFDSSVRYASRLTGSFVMFDPPSSPRDAYELEIPS